MAKTKHLLDYLATQEEAVLTYSASNMVLAVHSDAGYLNEANARSRAGGISSYQIIQLTPQTMELSSTLHKLSKM